MNKIIVANNSLLKPLFEKAINDDRFCLEKQTELKCIETINNNDFDLALVSPLIYSVISKKNDYRIIKAKVLAIEDFSNTVIVNITPNKNKLETIFFEELNEFIIVATKLVFSERYGVTPTLVGNAEKADIIVTCNQNKYPDYIKLDLTEDWFDTFEIPLVIGFWVVENSKYDDNTINIINNFSNKNLIAKEKIEKIYNSNGCDCGCENEHVHENEHNDCDCEDVYDYDRIGYRYWEWNDSISDALERTFDLLYYHNFANSIADIKIAGVKYEEDIENEND